LKYIIVCLLLVSATFANIKNIDSFSANFKQTVTNKFDSVISYTGSLKIKNNGLALWVYKTPVKKEIYINRQKVIINEPLLEQAIITKINSKIDFLEVLKSAKKIGKNIYTAKYNNKKYSIKTYSNGLPQKISYLDELENRIDIMFFDTKKNIFIKDSVFLFNIPKNYDTIME
jgi:outer membrane lipoprotein carrier protein